MFAPRGVAGRHLFMNDLLPQTDRRSLARVVLGLALVLALAACTSPPFDRSAQIAIGMVEEGFGDQYTISVEELTTEWTFTRVEPIVFSFSAGSASYDGQPLEPGCYSGESEEGAVLAFDGAEDVDFAAPASDPNCTPLPD